MVCLSSSLLISLRPLHWSRSRVSRKTFLWPKFRFILSLDNVLKLVSYPRYWSQHCPSDSQPIFLPRLHPCSYRVSGNVIGTLLRHHRTWDVHRHLHSLDEPETLLKLKTHLRYLKGLLNRCPTPSFSFQVKCHSHDPTPVRVCPNILDYQVRKPLGQQ